MDLETGKLTTISTGNFHHVIYSPSSKQARLRSTLIGPETVDISGVSPCGEYLVVTQSRVDAKPESVLINRQGTEKFTLEIADTHGLPKDWVWPEAVKVRSADDTTDIYGVVYRPAGFSPEKNYPVLDFSNGHPAMSFVPQGSFINSPGLDLAYIYAAAFASLGFVVALEGRNIV